LSFVSGRLKSCVFVVAVDESVRFVIHVSRRLSNTFTQDDWGCVNINNKCVNFKVGEASSNDLINEFPALKYGQSFKYNDSITRTFKSPI